MRRQGAMVMAVLTGCLAVGGCAEPGGGDTAATSTTFESFVPPEGISLEDWQAQTTAVCVEYEPQQDAIAAAQGQAESLADIVTLVDALLPLVDQYVADLNAIPVPPTRRADVERSYEMNERATELAIALRDAAAAGDEPTARAAQAALQAHAQDMTTLLLDLDVPACAGE